MQASSTSTAGTPPATASFGQLLAWAGYDWANSPFFAVIVTFVFSAYFTQAVAPDEISGTAAWGWMTTLSALIIALTSPVLGAIADVGGRRKPWLLACTLIGAAAIALLWYVRPEPSFMLLALSLVLVANVAIEVGQAFYNAMLPDLAPPSHVGRWSGWSWSLGYIGTIVALAIVLFGFVQGDPLRLGLDREAAEHIRINGPFVALWFLLFSLPLFLVTPDRPQHSVRFGESVRQGLAQLRRTLKNVRHEANIVRFLLARLIYNDGLNTLFAFGGIYAAGTFAMAPNEIVVFGLALNLTAGFGAFAFAYADDRLGSKPTILIAITGLFLAGIVALLATDKLVFWVTAMVIGIFIGPAQAASRTLMARLAPPELRTEMFGLYALTGKVTSFLGPFLFGTATWWFGSQRAGMAVILVMLVVGGLLLTIVREPRRE